MKICKICPLTVLVSDTTDIRSEPSTKLIGSLKRYFSILHCGPGTNNTIYVKGIQVKKKKNNNWITQIVKK